MRIIRFYWTTASELNNRGFEIQRKTILSDWRTLGFVSGNGTASQSQYYSYRDKISEGAVDKIFYRLKQIDFDRSFKYSEIIEIELTPTSFSLEQIYPNPFNPSTKIRYAIPLLGGDERGGLVTLRVYGVLGNKVATLVDEFKPAGSYEVEFKAEKLSSGVYFYTLTVDEYFASKKLILLK